MIMTKAAWWVWTFSDLPQRFGSAESAETVAGDKAGTWYLRLDTILILVAYKRHKQGKYRAKMDDEVSGKTGG